MNKRRLSTIIITLFFSVILAGHSQSNVPQNDTLKKFIQKKRVYNKKYGFGYRIQLYNGFETEAKKTRAKFRIKYPDIKTYVIYKSPEWKIQIGNYKTKLEADRALIAIKNNFYGAIVVPLGK
ncbi:MAG: SPOR domain-containing protein [Flavobacteriaceae bacterium]